ncbi:cholinesterase, partial [Thozetella sp. PMI_491]
GRPDRDGLDRSFQQLVVDYWSTFARTGNPNPDPAYLIARGHLETLSRVSEVGQWEVVNASQPTLRLLQWNGIQIPFPTDAVCTQPGVPLTVLE